MHCREAVQRCISDLDQNVWLQWGSREKLAVFAYEREYRVLPPVPMEMLRQRVVGDWELHIHIIEFVLSRSMPKPYMRSHDERLAATL